ncbi:MAG: NAD(P)(+) transhydrogenase (Re/Si-specific) subunit beta, partial [Mariniblastus sp.]
MGTVPQVAWLIAAVCFILSLGGLSRHESARRGNFLGIVGMMLAIGAAFWQATESELLGGLSQNGLFVLVGALVAGGIVGGFLAVRVAMTGMPQLVAILHSFVGLAAVLVGFSVFLHGHGSSDGTHGVQLIHDIEIFLGVFIGGLTFTGSVVAWGKLDGKINSRPLLIPGRHAINVGMLLVCLLLGVWFLQPTGFASELAALLIMLLISFVFGAHLVMAIGGADMPVVVSMLNSYSGWAAAAAGFMLKNDLLIITGALVGSSGAILSYIMCNAMNRSLVNVIFG